MCLKMNMLWTNQELCVVFLGVEISSVTCADKAGFMAIYVRPLRGEIFRSLPVSMLTETHED